MIRPEQIPEEVFAVLKSACDSGQPWSVRDTIAAAINAWPSGAVCHYSMGDSEGLEMVLPLPFPQEKQDD